MVVGVTEGFEKRLEIQGVGYRAQLQGKTLELALGYSHPVRIDAPEGIEFEVPVPTQVIVRGIDKQAVGEIAAQIRKSAAARALQGQGRALRGRARRAQGRQASVSRATTATLEKARRRIRRRRRIRGKVIGTRRTAARCPSTARIAASSRS